MQYFQLIKFGDYRQIALKNFYQSEGFLETTVQDSFSIVGDAVDIFFIIKPLGLFHDVKIFPIGSLHFIISLIDFLI